ncbi:hypothetical protein IKF30_00100 [Candidatus Saccharibacteria bacterium]|nr:hypothetical protein [Candidatus Saccharibacteria bacterium]
MFNINKSVVAIVTAIIMIAIHPFLAESYSLKPSTETIQYLRSTDETFIGYFRIPTLDIGVPIYHMIYDWVDATAIAQHYTDREDSAVYMDGWTNYPVVVDHSNQDFEKLPEVKVGDVAIIDWRDNTMTTYRCVETNVCTGDPYDIFDESGNSWINWGCEFMTYTCYTIHDPDGVFAARWEEIDNECPCRNLRAFSHP